MKRRIALCSAWFMAALSTSCAPPQTPEGCLYSEDKSVELAGLLCCWVEHPLNPLVQPADGDWLIGDPTLLLPDESPDGLWHMFAYGFMGIHHLTSPDGLDWQMLDDTYFGLGVVRPFVFRDAGGTAPVYYMFVEKYDGMTASGMYWSQSADLASWTEPQPLLSPESDWERDPNPVLGNPYLTFREDKGQYWMYYSAGNVFIPECNFFEPRHIGVATSESILGPYAKMTAPLISPDESNPLRNMGAGSIKLLDERVGGRYIAITNGIYQDRDGSSRSAIEVMSSEDGLSWEYVCDGPVIAPAGDGWKKAFVYAFDTVRVDDEIRLYFNARDEWADGVERIGMASLNLPCAR